jgi:ketosteroid isomerase-like protein
MAGSNELVVRNYLETLSAMGASGNVAEFFAPEVVIQEFPNRIAAHGRVRRMADLKSAYDQGRKLLQRQSYTVRRVIESGENVAVEVEWDGVLALPVMNLAAGSAMKAFVAMFFTLREGKIVSQRNYDCYPPFGEQANAQLGA